MDGYLHVKVGKLRMHIPVMHVLRARHRCKRLERMFPHTRAMFVYAQTRRTQIASKARLTHEENDLKHPYNVIVRNLIFVYLYLQLNVACKNCHHQNKVKSSLIFLLFVSDEVIKKGTPCCDTCTNICISASVRLGCKFQLFRYTCIFIYRFSLFRKYMK